MNSAGALLLIPNFRAASPANGVFVIGKKFLEGMNAYTCQWPGAVEVALLVDPDAKREPDACEVRVKDLPFAIHCFPSSTAELVQLLRRASAVNAALCSEFTHLSEGCQKLGVPLIYTAEQTLRTRKQIVCAETRNPLLRVRRIYWTTQTEGRYLRALRVARGVQCNGTPVYEAYRTINANPLLFFDTRVSQEMVVPESMLNARLSELLAGAALRLVFSGRLVAIKGVDHLPLVARELRRLRVPFTMDIYGLGDLATSLRSRIASLGLSEVVRLRGFLDFKTQWIPQVSRSADLFVCCHRQGDPSCTYLEAMSCGLPIVGYDNEAFHGIRALSQAGWEVPMDNPRQLAEVIARLSQDREQVATASRTARWFAAAHTFESEFKKRIDHMLVCSEAADESCSGLRTAQ